MKVTYRFANGETSVVEVSEEIGEVIMGSRRKEHADDEMQRYYCCCSLDGLDFEGDVFADENTVEKEMIESCEKERFWNAFSHLNETQKRRLRMRAAGMSMEEIAALEGISKQAVDESLKYARKKFKKFF